MVLECDIKVEDDKLELAEEIFKILTSKHSVEELMKLIEGYKDKRLFVVVPRDNPNAVNIVVDGSYSCGKILAIPIPKKFAVLEPDKNYFEQTLKANILLAVMGAEEKELHR